MSARVIAIDGPSSSGKSTVAAALAERLGLERLDTGAMYRAVTLAVLRASTDLTDSSAVTRVAHESRIDLGATVMVDGMDSTREIRGPAVTAAVSRVAAIPGVRSEMVARQRRWVDEHGGGVVEGRDIGSVVLPDAGLKVFLTASSLERARRRAGEIGVANLGRVADDLAQRDRMDSSRDVSPLVVSEGAVVIDTTAKSVDEVVDELLAKL